jgi:lysozyme
VGYGALRTSTLLKLLDQGKYKEASEQFERWVYAGGKPLEGLKKRRKAEKELFLGS